MFSLPPPWRSRFRVGSRILSLLAWIICFAIVRHVQPIAAKAYDDLCALRGMKFEYLQSDNALMIQMVAIAIPLLLARSTAVIGINLFVALLALLGATGLLSTAGNTPFECYSVNGHYIDYTSGLDGFNWGTGFATMFSYTLVVVDLAIWVFRKAIALWKAWT